MPALAFCPVAITSTRSGSRSIGSGRRETALLTLSDCILHIDYTFVYVDVLQQEMQCSRHHLPFILLDSPNTARIHVLHPIISIYPRHPVLPSPSSPHSCTDILMADTDNQTRALLFFKSHRSSFWLALLLCPFLFAMMSCLTLYCDLEFAYPDSLI
jgi:hypothetical protein